MNTLTKNDFEIAFSEARRRHMLDSLGGAATLTVLKDMFAFMKFALDQRGASAADHEVFIAAVERAIEGTPKLTDDDRRSVQDALASAFDGFPREPKVPSVKTNFLSRVRFDD